MVTHCPNITSANAFCTWCRLLHRNCLSNMHSCSPPRYFCGLDRNPGFEYSCFKHLIFVTHSFEVVSTGMYISFSTALPSRGLEHSGACQSWHMLADGGSGAQLMTTYNSVAHWTQARSPSRWSKMYVLYTTFMDSFVLHLTWLPEAQKPSECSLESMLQRDKCRP